MSSSPPTAWERRARALAPPVSSPTLRAWLGEEQQRVGEARERVLSARVAEETCHALTLASAYAGALRRRQGRLRAPRFRRPDRAHATSLLTRARRRRLGALQARRRHRPRAARRGAGHRARAMGHPARPDRRVLHRRRAPGERRRTMFAVGDEKQSIFSFQGAAPERFAAETQRFGAMVERRGERFAQRAAAGELALGAGDPRLRRRGVRAAGGRRRA